MIVCINNEARIQKRLNHDSRPFASDTFFFASPPIARYT